MSLGPLHPKEMGYYFTLAKVGLEMVVPIALGLWLDNLFGWQPWGVVGGAVLGLTNFAGLSASFPKQPAPLGLTPGTFGTNGTPGPISAVASVTLAFGSGLSRLR